MVSAREIDLKNKLATYVVMCFVLLLTSCGNEDKQKAEEIYHEQEKIAARDAINPATATMSLVVLGDSVAAGEGVEYGYTYDLNSLLGPRWVGGISDPVWQGEYQNCHDSGAAYGDIIAHDLNANLSKFACTGATYENGLIAQREYDGLVYRPAEFGNWQTQTDLNPKYDVAQPDTVILTFGADDVDFVGIVSYCVLGFSTDDIKQMEEEIHASPTPGSVIRQKLVTHYPTVEKFIEKTSADNQAAEICTQGNPGYTINKLFWDPINIGSIAQHYVDMVNAIQERGRRAGKVPKIIFTTYHNPLPKPSAPDDCHDTLDLKRENLDYLSSLLVTLNQTITNTVKELPGVEVADISQVMDGHRWCSDDPWTYGLSVLWLDYKSQAPFHPTRDGQKAIAEIVKGVIK